MFAKINCFQNVWIIIQLLPVGSLLYWLSWTALVYFCFSTPSWSSLIYSLNNSLKNLPNSSRVISPDSLSSSTLKTILCLSCMSLPASSEWIPFSNPLTKVSTSSFSKEPLLSVSIASKIDLLISENFSSSIRISVKF